MTLTVASQTSQAAGVPSNAGDLPMRLIASLTTLMLPLALAACASNTPRQPAPLPPDVPPYGSVFYDDCYGAYSRGFDASPGCSYYDYSTYRGTGPAPRVRRAPVERPELATPELPGLGLPGREPILRR